MNHDLINIFLSPCNVFKESGCPCTAHYRIKTLREYLLYLCEPSKLYHIAQVMLHDRRLLSRNGNLGNRVSGFNEQIIWR